MLLPNFLTSTAITKAKAFDTDGSMSKTDNDNNFSEAKLRDDFEILSLPPSRPPYLLLLPDFSQCLDKATR